MTRVRIQHRSSTVIRPASAHWQTRAEMAQSLSRSVNGCPRRHAAQDREALLACVPPAPLAAHIPGATLLTLTGIGQGLPRVTWPDVVDALLSHTS